MKVSKGKASVVNLRM